MCPRTKSQHVAETAREPDDSDDNTDKNDSNTTFTSSATTVCDGWTLAKRQGGRGSGGGRGKRKRFQVC